MAESDVKRVTTFEWVGISTGLLALIVSFLPWYTATASSEGVQASESNTAWSTGVGAWLPVLVLLATAVLVALPHIGVSVPNLVLIWLGLATAATVIILLRWLTLPERPDGGVSDVGLGLAKVDVDAGAGVGLIIGLVLAGGSAAVAFLTYRSVPGTKDVPQPGPA